MNKFFKIFVFTAGLFTLSSVSSVKADVLDDVSNLIKSGNAKEIAGYFAQEVELTILSDEKISSKPQAEIILQDFFSKHHPSSIKIIHKLTSNPALLYAELTLNTSNGVFRASFSVRNTSGKFFITSLEIQKNKD
jgi:hypothetical protein